LRFISLGQSGAEIVFTMSTSLSRAVLRRSTKLPSFGRTTARFESTTSKASEAAKDAAAKASEKAAEYRTKAAEGLSRVSAAAGPAVSNAAKNLGNAAKNLSGALGKVGGRTGRFIAFVERQIPPTVYYARVGLELSKLVFQGQKMNPPPVATFQTYFQRILQSLRNPSSLLQETAKTATPETIIERIRNINRSQLAFGAVLGAEVLGFFTVGEMIGRWKIVGYRGDTGAHH
jgi:F-type H+-transporting ATPase subunit g